MNLLNKPSVATFEEFDEWKARAKKEHPVLFFFFETVPGFFTRWRMKLRRAKYWIYYRLHPGHKYHILRPKIKPGYYDPSTMVMEGMFEALRRYVEDECGGHDKLIAWADKVEEYAPEQADMHREAARLYRWFNERKNRPWPTKAIKPTSPESFMGKSPSRTREESQTMNDMEQFYADIDEHMMIRLVKIHRGLWT